MDPSQITVVREEPDPCRVRLNIEIPAEIVAEQFGVAAKRIRKKVRIPGFRQGKAPGELVLRKYDGDIRQSAQEALVDVGVRQALEQEDKLPISRIELDNPDQLRVDANESFVFAVGFDVEPTFTLPDYRDVRVSEEPGSVSDEQVQSALEEWLGNRATFECVDRPAEQGDLVKVTYDGELTESLPDGEELPESARALLSVSEPMWIPLREPGVLPGAADQLAGCSVNEGKDISVHFPEDYYEASLQGRVARLSMRILEIQGQSIPELSDEYARQIGGKDAEDVRTVFRQQLELQERLQWLDRVRAQVVKAVTNMPDFPLPSRMLAGETQMVYTALIQSETQRGTPREELEQRQKELYSQAQEMARQRLKQRIVLIRIAREEDVQVTDEELNATIREMARREKTPEKQLRRRLEDSRRIFLVRERLVVDKVLDWLVARAVGTVPAAGANSSGNEEAEQQDAEGEPTASSTPHDSDAPETQNSGE